MIVHHHVSLSVLDLDAQRAWYSRTLGFIDVVEEYAVPEPPVRTAVLSTESGLRLELIERAGAEPRAYPDPLAAAQHSGLAHWALQVDDLDATYRRLTRDGAHEVWPPADAVRPGDRFAYIHDPEGNLLELIEVNATRTN